MTIKAYTAYEKHAKGCDELNPVSKSCHNWYHSGTFLSTPVDALDTLKIMQLDALYASAKKDVLDKLNVQSSSTISFFETTIRILGGLVSAYEFDNDPALLKKAKEVGDMLIKAYNTPTGLPCSFFVPTSSSIPLGVSGLAAMGTNQLEFGYLSDITGDFSYKQKVTRYHSILYDRFCRS